MQRRWYIEFAFLKQPSDFPFFLSCHWWGGTNKLH